jgi:hypothetical protein
MRFWQSLLLCFAWVVSPGTFAGAAEDRPVTSRLDWQQVAPKPDFNPGFLLNPDDSEAAAVFQCDGANCSGPKILCTARIFPEKPEIWAQTPTEALVGTDRTAILARYGFVEEDVDRIIPGFIKTVLFSAPGGVSYGLGKILISMGQKMILSDLQYANAEGRRLFHTVVWVSQNRLHRVVCSSAPENDILSRSAALDFAASH